MGLATQTETNRAVADVPVRLAAAPGPVDGQKAARRLALAFGNLALQRLFHVAQSGSEEGMVWRGGGDVYYNKRGRRRAESVPGRRQTQQSCARAPAALGP